jgi:hypothetical protein
MESMTQELDIQNYDLKSIQKLYNQTNQSNTFLNEYTLLDVEEGKKRVLVHLLQRYKHKGQDYIQAFVEATSTELINALFQKDGNKPGNTQMVGVKNIIKDERKLNPSFFQETYRIVNIDSMYRNNLWLTNYTYDSKTSTNMNVTLNDSLDNVTTLELTNVCIPFTFYNIDAAYGNNYFYIQNSNTDDISKISIPGGNYEDIATLVENINYAVSESGITDISFGVEDISHKITITNSSTDTSYDVIFYDDDDPDESFHNQNTNALSPDTQSKINNNLGWILGFRTIDNSNNCLEYLIPPNNAATPVTSESLCFIPYTKYFIIVIDDLNKNQTNKGLVQISNTRPFIKKTMHYKDTVNDLSLNCLKNSNFETYEKMSNRQLTKSELYSALQINNYRSTFNQKNSKLDANLINNVFAIVPFENKSLNWGTSIFTSDKNKFKRKYSGPVNISKLNVKLLDDRGNIMNLNGAEWSFSMISTHLYQH